jgi:hypothetical protein
MESGLVLAKPIMELQETFLGIPLAVVRRLFGRLWIYLCCCNARRAVAHPAGFWHGLSDRSLLHLLDNRSIRLDHVRQKTSLGVIHSPEGRIKMKPSRGLPVKGRHDFNNPT